MNKTGQLVLLLIPNFLHSDQHSVGKLTGIFDEVGSIQAITQGVYCIATDKTVSSWAGRLREAFGVDFQFYLIPVSHGELAQYRQYLPPPVTSMVGAQLRVA